jgi:hypothetical protein
VTDDLDLVFASGPPFGSFEVGRQIARRLKRSYVLDYRDLWSANPHATRVPGRRTIRLEQELLAGCAAAIAISPSLARSLETQFGVAGKVHVVTNGFA